MVAKPEIRPSLLPSLVRLPQNKLPAGMSAPESPSREIFHLLYTGIPASAAPSARPHSGGDVPQRSFSRLAARTHTRSPPWLLPPPIPAARTPASGGIPAPESSPQSAVAAARKPPRAARPQAGNRPVLHPELALRCHLAFQPTANPIWGVRPPEQPRHSHIRPQLHRQRQILLTPRAKPKPLGSEKIFRSYCAFPDCQIPPTPAHMRGFFWLCKIIVPAVGGWLPNRKMPLGAR